MNDRELIQNIWNRSKPFDKKVVSYLYMITHPIKCLKMINFAIKVILYFDVETEYGKKVTEIL